MNKSIMRAFGFNEEVMDYNKGTCPFCKKPVNMDLLITDADIREYGISGLCKECQDKVFDE